MAISCHAAEAGAILYKYIYSMRKLRAEHDWSASLKRHGSSPATGGTLLYIANGGFTNSSQNMVVNVAPMTSGTYSNPPIAVWQDVSDQSQFNSSNGGNLNIQSGILYVPNVNAQVQLSASAGTTASLARKRSSACCS